jgi:sulfatase modifying factor 1
MIKSVITVMTLLATVSSVLAEPSEDMALLPAGSYVPFYLKKENDQALDKELIYVDAFWLDKKPVTNREYLAFVHQENEWKKSQVKALFSDSHYLQHWKSDFVLDSSEDLDKPVVNVSWFAASAYCEARDARLPSTEEWEYALYDGQRNKEANQKTIISWYSVPNKELPKVGCQPANGFGVFDLIAVIWEWTSDFNSFMAPADSRGTGEKNLFCGGGGLNASNLGDYAAFMRYSYRESLQGNFTGKNLGFRCAKDKK